MKTGLDLLLGGVLLLLTLPVLMIAALVVKVASRGPIFFTQHRVGQRERVFRIYKFRTMHTSSTGAASSVTVRGDPRVVLGTQWLRKYKIDELPQLINVLNGTMSLVGPRPTVAEDYEKMTLRQRTRASVKPGLTGLAQIRGGAALPWPKRIEYDLQYIRTCSIWLDVTIMVRTAFLVMSGRADSNPTVGDEWTDSHDTFLRDAPAA